MTFSQLADDDEHLRDTIFFAIYGTRVMFDTYNNAHDYQVERKARGRRSVSIVIEEDGATLVSGRSPGARGYSSCRKGCLFTVTLIAEARVTDRIPVRAYRLWKTFLSEGKYISSQYITIRSSFSKYYNNVVDGKITINVAFNHPIKWSGACLII